MMKLVVSVALLVVLAGNAAAETRAASALSRWKLADAAAEACMASCASQATACRRTCPATFSTPCEINCDNQVKFCRQSCQRR